MYYVYPAIYLQNADKSYTVKFPDFKEYESKEEDLGNALSKASQMLHEKLSFYIKEDLPLPLPTDNDKILLSENENLTLITTEIKDEDFVRRTISIPKWLDEKANKANISLSNFLRKSLIENFDKTKQQQDRMDEIRDEFWEFLKNNRNEFAKSTLSTLYSDANYTYKHDIGINFWDIFHYDDSFEKTKILLKKKFDEQGANNSSAYILALKEFKNFIDTIYPNSYSVFKKYTQ